MAAVPNNIDQKKRAQVSGGSGQLYMDGDTARVFAKAEDDVEHMVASARREAEDTVHRAQNEADRLIQDGNDSYRRSVDEGIAEQERLVSESEVVRRANEEAHRIVDTAHADSERLRTECDEFVDGKLSEFESSLSEVLRTVTRDRQALRRGAGVSRRRSE